MRRTAVLAVPVAALAVLLAHPATAQPPRISGVFEKQLTFDESYTLVDTGTRRIEEIVDDLEGRIRRGEAAGPGGNGNG